MLSPLRKCLDPADLTAKHSSGVGCEKEQMGVIFYVS